MKKVLELLKKHQQSISFLVFGGLTTLINYAVYLPCYNWLHLSGTVSNVIAWVAAVLFAYVTNKPFVFQSHDWSWPVVIPEMVRFVGCRAGSGLLETAVIYVTVDYLHWNGNLIKLLVSGLVIVMNFVASKFIVFKRK